MMFPAPARRQRRGSILPLTMILFVALVALGLTIFTLSSGSAREAYLGYAKARATASAAAGLHALYAQTAAALDARQTVPQSITGTLTSAIGSSSSTDGSYTATITGTSVSGSVTTYTIQSVGLAPGGGTQSVIYATFTAQVPPGGTWHFPDGAIVSNGPVQFGNSHTNTADNSGGNFANIFANGSVTMGNNASINGSVTTATIYSGSNGAVSGTVTTGVTTAFPSPVELAAWRTSWLSTAKSGTQYASCPASGSTITAPAYINSDLNNTLTVKPCPGTSSVVYVNGNISGNVTVGSDGTASDGVTLVCTGDFTAHDLTELYEPYTATVVDYGINDLSFSNSERGVIEGVIYAVNAGFTFKNPGWTFNGAVIAGGPSGVSFGNGGGNATVGYPGNNLNSNSNSFSFAPQLSPLSQWVQTQ